MVSGSDIGEYMKSVVEEHELLKKKTLIFDFKLLRKKNSNQHKHGSILFGSWIGKHTALQIYRIHT